MKLMWKQIIILIANLGSICYTISNLQWLKKKKEYYSICNRSKVKKEKSWYTSKCKAQTSKFSYNNGM